MASYGYGNGKYINSDQGHLGLANITLGRMYINVVPSNVFSLPDWTWWRDNGYLYYGIDYPNPLVGRFPHMATVGTVKGTSVYAALYVHSTTVPSGTPISPLMGDTVRLYVISGDMNGEVTDDNPAGFRIGAFNEFKWWDLIETWTVEVSTDPVLTSRQHTNRAAAYLFFATADNDNTVWLINAPKKQPEDFDISLNPLVFSRTYRTASQAELRPAYEYYSADSLQIRSVDGELVNIDDLPEETGGGTSTSGGGGGNFSLYSDDIDFPPLPTVGAANSGLLTLYNPTIAQLRSLSNWLWSRDLLDSLEKMFAQPMDLIVTLNVVPCEPSSLGNLQPVKIGGVDTNIDMQKVLNQYSIFDCGRLNLKEYYGSALDYGQYTKVSLYLPFINVVQLKTDEVMDATLHLKYYVDLFSGSCVAMLKVIREGLNSILYSFEGNMAVTLPLISRDFSNQYNAIAKTAINALGGGFPMSAAGGLNFLDSAISVMSTKPSINRTGGSTATGGLLGVKKPYLIVERPIQSLADGYKDYVGYPSNITAYLYTLKGYTEVEEVICDTLRCTKEEQDAIVARLKSGIIL